MMKNKKLLFSMLVLVVVCLFVGVKDAKASEYEENLIKKIAPDGKNAVLKGTNYMESATGRKRNKQIGGHKA